MIEYIKLFWEGAPEGEPAVILYEVDTEDELEKTCGKLWQKKRELDGASPLDKE